MEARKALFKCYIVTFGIPIWRPFKDRLSGRSTGVNTSDTVVESFTSWPAKLSKKN